MTNRLNGQTALITGASQGTGRALAECSARHGVEVAVHYREGRDQADAVAKAVSDAGGKARAFQADLANGELRGNGQYRENDC